MAQQIKDCLIHWRKKLERGVEEEKALDIIRKLYKVPITVEFLQETGIGKVVKQLGKRNGKIGEKATIVYKKWKDVVSSSSNDKLPKSSSKPSLYKSPHKQHSSSPVAKEQEKLSNGNSIKKSDNSRVNEPQYQKLVNRNGHTKQDISKPLKSSNDIPKSRKYSDDDSHSSNDEENSKYVPGNLTDASDFTYNPERPEIVVPSMRSSLTNVEYKPTPINVNNHKSSHRKKEKTLQLTDSAKSSKTHEKVSENIKPKVKSNANSIPKTSKPKHSDENGSDVRLKTQSVPSSGKPNKDKSLYNESEKSKTAKRTSTDVTNVAETKPMKKLKVSDSEVFTASEVSFEDCLGFNDIVTSKKKKPTKVTNVKVSSKISPSTKDKSKGKKHEVKSSEKHRKSSKQNKPPSEEKSQSLKGNKSSSKKKDKISSMDLVPKDLKVPPPASTTLKPIDILSTLPEIQPNYKPLPRYDFDFGGSPKKKILSNEEAILFTSSKKDRTAVYSGRRHNYLSEVPTLFDACTRVLIENIDYLEYFGGVPYYILKPVLERCTPQQLYQLEDYNPYILEDTNELWEKHCQKDFRNQCPDESETWRDLYLRVFDEKEKKLKALTANISASMSKSNPVRQVKLAYVDSVVKPPRDVARKQAKHGTGLPVNHLVKPGPPSKATARPTAPAINSAVTARTAAPVPPKKPKVAPLMAKTLKAMKKVYRR